MTIACVGITVLDRVFQVNNLPDHGGKFVANNYFEVGGGPAATAAVAVKRLGHDVEFIGRFGGDSVADAMSAEFEQYGVGLNHKVVIPDASSAFSAVVVDDSGERMIINYQDSTLSTSIEALKDIDFSKFSAILCDVRWVAGAKYALEQGRKFNIPTILDADITPEPMDELVALADHVAFSEVGLVNFSGETDPEAGLLIAQAKTDGQVYVTVGSKGCYWLESGNLCHKAGKKITVVDTTGAGDTFHGALAVAVAENMENEYAVNFSNSVAALKCTKLGGREGIPTRTQVEQYIKDDL
ncbi:PfkB family carbohydrate kinase [Vibrio sp. SS-MA-C1-2]|uniref:PfkB family carbohydrate kinase n=1 Tax=Vibrio sp. SS-MA-C1-2 TaxID=2908646 RepID=UPI001F376C6F|nr:PfkB family carbohydrate kinase [Vibrio sp. SS-MA-C1-2]UJF18244.1 PfkB family carbohydrate kinase [Vibrio sp. SS-MA-C1-2]